MKEKVSQKTEERILLATFGVLILFLIMMVGYLYQHEKTLPKEERIVTVFKGLEEEGPTRNRRFRDYESIINGMMDLFEYEFLNLEMENLEIGEIHSGTVAQIENGKWMVLTNELVPEAYHSGPAALFFSEKGPERINK